ncbi:TIGR03084 family metal-binding protein [Actinacidiphila acididurans]|uniref:TIGR03084 family protein n=1 Tax=Actinacidiphila acididurans TaxID=2784346 RepID=A0ABS2TZ43_9ACTN|nr:TIGR03084 family metal-binding protein [Actinacidiphila acididurans]MBM9508608.1 TIGR03084 family protein [Actinacidiphila acididurans]
MTAMQDVFTDLVAEGDELDAIVAGLTPEQWNTPTPAPGWTVKHQIAHLAFILHLCRVSATDAAAFETETAPAKVDFQGSVDAKLAEYVAADVPELLQRWRDERTGAAEAMAAVPKGETVPWLTQWIPASVLAAAAMMETLAHGQDVRDGLGITRTFTDRIGHVAFFGTRTRDFGYLVRGEQPPAEEFRFELTAPSGIQWAFGPKDAEQRITGPAVDFCLLVTRRRHRDDLALTAIGSEADRWLDIAQAYGGPAGNGRTAAQFASA